MMNDFIPNGILLDEATSLVKVLNHDIWLQAEARSNDLLECIQPSHSSEMHRNDVVLYLKNLIMNNVPCQVVRVGSVPLKTYLPEGDIDLTAFGEVPSLKENFFPAVYGILRNEEMNENAEFHVKDVEYIPAQVKIIKCMVGNFKVDISFNQIEGLSTLCFFEEVDDFIRQDHLFKRSIILIKAWCYHESFILGSHCRLLSSYALDILVLYIFHVYNNQFAGPLEVLYRFLNFFSKFDWENYCISLRGPVPKGSLPDMRAQPPLRGRQEPLLNENFFNDCISCYAMIPSIQQGRLPFFVPKYMNIIDPLRANNNLGRSVSRDSFFRIKKAISDGAEQLEKLLHCPEEALLAQFDFIFQKTWAANGNGFWMELLYYNLYIRPKNVEKSTSQDHANHLEESILMFGTSSNVYAVSQTGSSKNKGIFIGEVTSDIQHKGSMKGDLTNKGKSPMYSSNEVQIMHKFSGVWPSSEFPHTYSEVPIQHSFSSMTESQYSPMSLIYYTPPSHSISRTNLPSSSLSSSKAFQPDEVRGVWVPHSTSESVYLPALQIASSSSSQGPMCGSGSSALDTHVLAGPGSNMNPEPHGSTSENYAEQGSDTLCGDFGKYWINLQYARLCHNAQSEGNWFYPPSVIPPFYFRDNRLRKKSSNFMNMMAHGAPFVAEMENQHGNEPIGYLLPRITEGTQTFLPNPRSPRRYFESYNRTRLRNRLLHGNKRYES